MEMKRSIPQGLKPAVSAVLTARLKPCPFKTDLCNDFQRLSGGFGGFDGTAKAVPFQNRFM
jgi:hypothetical protein